jgi:hypothetical protein
MREMHLRSRAAASICVMVAVSAIAACAAQEQVLHGKLTQWTPTICVAAPHATGDCFDPSSVDISELELSVGDCVTVRYIAAKDSSTSNRIKKIRKERCT